MDSGESPNEAKFFLTTIENESQQVQLPPRASGDLAFASASDPLD
jgi:hypothetical protein